jgi:hypothetical protein
MDCRHPPPITCLDKVDEPYTLLLRTYQQLNLLRWGEMVG